MSNNKLIKALEEAGLKCEIVGYIDSEETKTLEKQIDEFLKKKAEQQKKSEEWLKKNPMRFKRRI